MNRLGTALSPYLRHHADNPVDWMEWGAEAFAAARVMQKPILLSIGYAACHWCHVMAEESFENPAIAAQMNRDFVCIKVDREERPDIDAIYQAGLALLGQQGGWPLTVFLTPDLECFWGGSYFPPEPRWGLSSLPEILESVRQNWQENQGAIRQNSQAIRDGLMHAFQHRGGNVPGLGLLVQAADAYRHAMDPFAGGMAGQQKFPQTTIFRFLGMMMSHSPDTRLGVAVENSLNHMAQGGLYDHPGGGFFRYCVDSEWHVPHFEKMLSDNALLVTLYTEIWQQTKADIYRARVEETVQFLLREMAIGAVFAGSLDADSDGVEGGFYLWDTEEIHGILGEDAGFFWRFFGMVDGVLNRLHAIDHATPENEIRLQEMLARLAKHRDGRNRPLRDDKILTDWNGMAVVALARAGAVFERPEWVAGAVACYDALCAMLWHGTDLAHMAYQGRVSNAPALLEDYGSLALAATVLAEVTGETRFSEDAAKLVTMADAMLGDAEKGGWFQCPQRKDMIVRAKHAADHPHPSGTAMMVEACIRLWWLTGNQIYYEKAVAAIQCFSGALEGNFLALAGLLCATTLCHTPPVRWCVGEACGT